MRQIFLTLFAGVAIGYFLSAKKKKTIATKSCEESRILENHSDLQTEIRMMEIADEKLSTAMNFVELEIKNFELKDEIGSLRKEISLLIKEKNELRRTIASLEIKLRDQTISVSTISKPTRSKHESPFSLPPNKKKTPANLPKCGCKTEPFLGIDLFPEIESDARFFEYVGKMAESPVDGKCVLCRKSMEREDILLSNGRMIHKECCEWCLSKLNSLESDKEADLFLKENTQDVFRAKWLCLYFPDYPPDWKSRKRTVLEKAGYECEECGESEDELHVHHKIPIGQGGSNSIENLKCLCRECHEKIHGSFDPVPDNKKEKSPWQLRKEALEKAILIKEDVEFDYTSQEGEKTHRKITPQRFENRHGWLHVKGYCHLRNAERTFNIRRMRNLRVKDDDGTTITLYQMAQD